MKITAEEALNDYSPYALATALQEARRAVESSGYAESVLSGLPPREQYVVGLRLEGKTQDEIAEALSVQSNRVRGVEIRGLLRLLARALEEQSSELHNATHQ